MLLVGVINHLITTTLGEMLLEKTSGCSLVFIRLVEMAK